MKVLIKKTAGSDYSRDDHNKTLKSIRGQWVNVDTQYLFRDQYNLADYNLRIYDRDIDAVQDDERKGLVKCGYCGAQFHSMEALQAHYVEEEGNAHNCDTCKDYINGIMDIQHTQDEYTDDDGNTVQVRTTKYIHGKKCRFSSGCVKFEHRNHKPEIFTPANTYFLKYPNGYAEYFKTLPNAEKWSELGFNWCDETRTAEFRRPNTGTYNVRLAWTPNGWELFADNKRTRYYMPSDLLHYCLSNHYHLGYCIRFGPDPDDRMPGIYADTWEKLPQATRDAVAIAVEYLRECLRSEYVREFINNKEG